ncbi:MAG: hypothetical protein V7739_17710 [Motiliproteus sp.]
MRNIEIYYEQIRPLIIWLGLLELAWTGSWLLGALSGGTGYIAITVVWMISTFAWMVAAISMAKKGIYLKFSSHFSNLLGFLFVISYSVVLFASTDVGRSGLLLAASQASDSEMVAFHTLRLLAIGTIIKYRQGQLPLHFLILGSVPDFLFALSAVVIVVIGTNVSLDSDFLILWHCIGIGVFFGAGISMFFSVPSPIRISHNKPDSRLTFEFPMVLAPNFTVPLFALAHMFALAKLA